MRNLAPYVRAYSSEQNLTLRTRRLRPISTQSCPFAAWPQWVHARTSCVSAFRGADCGRVRGKGDQSTNPGGETQGEADYESDPLGIGAWPSSVSRAAHNVGAS